MNQIYSKLNLFKWSIGLLVFTILILLLSSCDMGKYYAKKRIKTGSAQQTETPTQATGFDQELTRKSPNR